MENREIVIDCNEFIGGFKIESIDVPMPTVIHTNLIYLEGNSFRPRCPAPGISVPQSDPLEKEAELQKAYRRSYPCPSCKKYISGCILRTIPPEPFINAVNCPICLEDITDFIYFHIEPLSEEKTEKFRTQLKLREEIVMEKIVWRLRDDPKTFYPTDLKTEQCSVCNAKIVRAKMEKHHQVKHKKYLCEHCGIYVGLVPFKRHQIKHGEKKFKCTKCDIKFHYKKSLVRHQLVHDKDQSSMYSCKFCGHFLTSRWNLQQHIRIHTKVTPYKCLLCKKYFRYNCSLKSHIILNHPGKSIPDSMTRIMDTSLGKEKESMDGIIDEEIDKKAEKNGDEDDDEEEDEGEESEEETEESEDEYNSEQTEENADESESEEMSEDFDGS